jgi:hypothetical protein
MTIDDLRSYKHAQPFTPFDIVMRDGTVVHVELGERMSLSFSGRMAYVFEGEGLSFIEVARVAAIKPKRRSPRRARRPR